MDKFPFSGCGKIIYDPYRPGLKTKTKWWVVVKIDPEIARYYRWWVQRRYHVTLHKPAWGAHISVIRGEKPRSNKMHLWKKHHNEMGKFKYSHVVRQTGDTTNGDRPNHYWFVEVDSPQLKTIRDEFGIPSNWKFHITIGRTYD